MDRKEFERKFSFIQEKINGLVHVCGSGFIIYADNYRIKDVGEELYIVFLILNNTETCGIELASIEDLF